MNDTPRVTVPVEPTEAMIEAGRRAGCIGSSVAGLVYDAMLSTAPAPEGGAVDVIVQNAVARSMAEDPQWSEMSAPARAVLMLQVCRRVSAALATREEAPAEAGEREKLIQDLSDAERWRRLPGNENHLATAALFERAISALRAQPQARKDAQPIPVTIFCPQCALPHVDEGEWATTRHHKTHQCQGCGHEWRPFPFATVGVAHPAPDALRVQHEADMAAVAQAGQNLQSHRLALTEAERKLAEAVGRSDDLLKALEWYGEQARLARLIHSEGDAGRHALADDGGSRARAFIANHGPSRARTFISKEAERG